MDRPHWTWFVTTNMAESEKPHARTRTTLRMSVIKLVLSPSEQLANDWWYISDFDIIKWLLIYLLYASLRCYFDIIIIFWNFDIIMIFWCYHIKFTIKFPRFWYYHIIFLLSNDWWYIRFWYYMILFWYCQVIDIFRMPAWDFPILILSWYYFDIIKWLLIYQIFILSWYYFDIITSNLLWDYEILRFWYYHDIILILSNDWWYVAFWYNHDIIIIDILKWLLIYQILILSWYYVDVIMILFWYYHIKFTVRFWDFEILILSYYFDNYHHTGEEYTSFKSFAKMTACCYWCYYESRN